MRTTLNVSDHLLIAAKRLAAARHTTLTEVLEDSLRAYLAAERQRPQRPAAASLPINRTARAVDGVDLDDSSALLELE